MKFFCVRTTQWALEFDKNYGIYNRSGWTLVHNGSTLIELEPSLFRFIFRFIFRRF